MQERIWKPSFLHRLSGESSLDDRYAVLVADVSSYGFHVQTHHRANVSTIWFDPALSSNEGEQLFESGCRSILGPRPTAGAYWSRQRACPPS